MDSLNLERAEAYIEKSFISNRDADALFASLKADTPWRQDVIKMWGKEIPIPRLQQWYGDNSKTYTWSGIKLQPLPWTEALLKIKEKIEAVSDLKFNSVLLNYYRNGKDSVGWHSDSEKELGANPFIASLSLGVTRNFQLKANWDDNLKLSIPLTNGSLLLMKSGVQQNWKHQIPKQPLILGERINLTFRNIL